MSELEKTNIEIETENVSEEAILEQPQETVKETTVETIEQKGSNADFVNKTSDTSASQAATPELGLKWAKFLGYFSLWVGALSNFYNGIQYLTGSVYESVGSSASVVYSYFPGLKPVDIIIGIATFATGVLAALAALSIIKRKKTAIKYVPLTYLTVAVLETAYIVLGLIVTGQFALTGQIAIQIIVSAVMYFVNKYYFEKRQNIFIN